MRNYTRKTNRGQVSQELMLSAATEVIERGGKLRKIAKELKICHATLFRFVRRLKAGENPTVGYKPKLLFTVTQEREIAKHLAYYADVFFGLLTDDARTLAHQCALHLKYPVSCNWIKNGTASKEWLEKFLQRNPQVRVRAPKVNAEGSKRNVTEYFNRIYKLYDEFKFLPSRIYHLVDVSVTPGHKYRKMANGSISVLVGQAKPVNVQLAANASGETIPPMFVLPTANKLKEDLQGFIAIENSSGQMTTKEFPTYLKHFIYHTKPNPSDPVLLLLDNHQYHVDMDVLEEARANSIILLSFPQYCKDEQPNIQPLHKTMESFEKACKFAQVDWLEANKGKSVTAYNIPGIVSKVLPSEKNVRKSFRKTGLWPFDPSVVTGEEFVPSSVEEHCWELEEDIENFLYWKTMNVNARLKPRLPNFKSSLREGTNVLPPSASNTEITASSTCVGVMCPQVDNNQIQAEPRSADRKKDPLNDKDAQPGPSGSGTLQQSNANADSSDSNTSNTAEPEDPLKNDGSKQCRFCGEFTQNFIIVNDENSYIARNKTALTLNDLSVELDFNNDRLPKTVCGGCDAKLQEMFDFVRLVKAAQNSLIDVANEIEKDETETLIVKIECDSPTHNYSFDVSIDENNDKDGTVDALAINETVLVNDAVFAHRRKNKTTPSDEVNDENENKDAIDSLTVGETVFLKENFTRKRKSEDIDTCEKQKKTRTKDLRCEDSEFIILIKEEVTEIDERVNRDAFRTGHSEFNDTGPDIKPSEIELATYALIPDYETFR